jgi:peptide/nickel transport system ATP-binding protein
MSQPILSIPKLDISINQSSIIRNFSLALYPGQCIGLVGESGSGKTISALSILQLLPHNASVSLESQIIYRGQDLLNYSEKQMRQIRGKRIGMIFQDAMVAFNPVLTIGYQINEILQLHFKLSYREAQQRALEWLDRVGIQDVLRSYQSYPHELSGGMRQRAMIAMAIATDPELLIADEPTTALDTTLQNQIIELLQSLKKEKKCALLFIGHDLSVVSKLADDMIVLKQGEIVEKNSVACFFEKPQHPYSQELLDAVLSHSPRHTEEIQSDVLLAVRHLKCYFPIRSGLLRRAKAFVKAVDDVSFVVRRGETVALIGESGSGKTTTAKAVLQLLKVTNGEVIFDGTDLCQISGKSLRKIRPEIQIIFQDSFSALNPRMTIGDSVCEGLKIQKKFKNKKIALETARQLLKQVELPEDFVSRYPHELSGGQRQRVCIARALALLPKLLILDEPTSALDVSTQKQILALLDRLQRELHIAYLLITHNMSVVSYLAHRVIAMKNGRIQTVIKSDYNDFQ